MVWPFVLAGIVRCPKCENQHSIKADFKHNKQHHKYKNYKHQLTQTTDKNATKHAFALYLYAIGLSINVTGRMPKVEPSTIPLGKEFWAVYHFR